MINNAGESRYAWADGFVRIAGKTVSSSTATLLATVSGGTYPWREQIVETWQELTADALRHAAAEASLNGLSHFIEQESLAVLTFGKALQAAVEEPAPPSLLPSWDAAERALPGVLQQLEQAVLTGS